MSENNVPFLKLRLFLGLAIIVLGVFLTLDNLGVVDLGAVLGHWPVLLVAFGVSRLWRSPAAGCALIFVGAMFLAPRYLDVGLLDLWPLLLLFFGVSLVWRSVVGGGRRRRRRKSREEESDSDQVDLFGCLDTQRRRITTHGFRGGTLTAFAGGCDLDLREASLAEGEAKIEVLAFWGGIQVRVPAEWNVNLQVTPIMGGADDSRAPKDAPVERVDGDATSLVVQGFVLMGGVEVRL